MKIDKSLVISSKGGITDNTLIFGKEEGGLESSDPDDIKKAWTSSPGQHTEEELKYWKGILYD